MPAQTVSRTAPHRPPVGQRRGRNSESPWPPHHQTSGEPGFPTAWTPPYAGKGATGPTRAGAASIDQPPNACPGSVQRHGPTSDRLGHGTRRPARRECPQKGHSLPWRQALGRWRRQRRAHVRGSQPASPSRDFPRDGGARARGRLASAATTAPGEGTGSARGQRGEPPREAGHAHHRPSDALRAERGGGVSSHRGGCRNDPRLGTPARVFPREDGRHPTTGYKSRGAAADGDGSQTLGSSPHHETSPCGRTKGRQGERRTPTEQRPWAHPRVRFERPRAHDKSRSTAGAAVTIMSWPIR